MDTGSKEALTKYADQLNEPGYDRTPDGYAAMFGQFFQEGPTLSLDNLSWMTLTNASVQYVTAIRPGKMEPQLSTNIKQTATANGAKFYWILKTAQQKLSG